ncbi:MAG: molybdopterin cofactor-binding domain-containing protein [Gammaproteobacteria bacterium]
MLTRRQFLKASGSLTVYFSLAPKIPVMAANNRGGLPGSLVNNSQLDTWIRIDAAGSVTLFSGKSELGQGIRTALAQIAAEELDVAVGRMRMAGVDTDHSPDEAYTFGSISVQQSGSALRVAAAEARHILMRLAADELGVAASGLRVRNGQFYLGNKAAGLDYWRLLGGKRFETTLTNAGDTKPRSSYAVVGTSIKRLDIPAKAFGEVSFIQDLRLANMLHARMVRSPRPGGRLIDVDKETTARMPGVVKIVQDGGFLAVVAEREEQAERAAERLKSDSHWRDQGRLPDAKLMTDWLRSTAADVSVVSETGRPGSVNAAKRFSAGYSRPYQAHASLSPSIALALKEDKGLTVWSHGQGMYPLRGAIARVVGLKQKQVRCIHTQSSGCYGHNGADDAACDAAVIAMHLPGRPVRLQWARADEFRWEPYGSAMSMQVEAGLDGQGRIVDWQYHVWSCSHSTRPAGAVGAGRLLAAGEISRSVPAPPPINIPPPLGGGDRNAVPLYAFPHQRVTKHFVKQMPQRVSALRALGAYANVFAIESFMDELALVAGADPLEFRLKHLTDKRAIAVLEKLGETSGWSQFRTAGTQGKGLGFAQYKNHGAYCAVAVFLKIDPASGDIKLDRAIAVVDAGLIINPDGVRNQVEGGLIQGSSWTLKEQVQFTQDAITTHDWISYPILRFDEVPQIEVELIDRPGLPSLGVGEASQGPVAAAIANAVANATGKRLRDLPLIPSRLQNPAV